MKHNKKASGNISRRSFAQTVGAAIIAAPLISAQQQNESSKRQTKAPRQQNKVAQPQIQEIELREHIPPFEISSGSVTIHTVDMNDVSDYTTQAGHGKHVITRGKQIKYVRVINTNGTILADYYGNNRARGGQIKIWVTQPTNGDANMVLKTVGAGTSRQLELEIPNQNHRFIREGSCSTGHRQHRRKCNDNTARLLKVSVLNSDEAEIEPPVTTTGEIEIDRILIWTM